MKGKWIFYVKCIAAPVIISVGRYGLKTTITIIKTRHVQILFHCKSPKLLILQSILFTKVNAIFKAIIL